MPDVADMKKEKKDELIVACENDSKNKNKIASLMTTAMINLNILLKLINK